MKIEAELIRDRFTSIERSLVTVLQSLSGQTAPIEEPFGQTKKSLQRLAPEDLEAELIEHRLAAIEKSVVNIAQALSAKSTPSLAGCRWVKVCTYIYCCKWGPPGNGGTAVCLEQCCGAWEHQLKCD